MAHPFEAELSDIPARVATPARVWPSKAVALHAVGLLLTWVPLLVIPWAWSADPAAGVRSLPGIAWLMALTGIGHIASSAYLYVDAEVRPLVAGHLGRFVMAPLALCALYAVVTWTGGPALALLMTGHQVWQLYHYQRQNYGCLALGARAAGAGPVPPDVHVVFDTAVVAGALGQLAAGGRVAAVLWGRPELVTPAVNVVYLVALGVQVAALVLAARFVHRHRDFASRPLTAMWLATGAVFFLPSVLVRDVVAGFWPYAMAHGLQYLAIMGLFAGSARRAWIALLAFAASTTIGFMGLMLLQNTGGVWDGVGFALVASHFVIDAKVWRMREPFQRQLMGARLAALMPRVA
jgi:hypothetical protein